MPNGSGDDFNIRGDNGSGNIRIGRPRRATATPEPTFAPGTLPGLRREFRIAAGGGTITVVPTIPGVPGVPIPTPIPGVPGSVPGAGGVRIPGFPAAGAAGAGALLAFQLAALGGFLIIGAVTVRDVIEARQRELLRAKNLNADKIALDELKRKQLIRDLVERARTSPDRIVQLISQAAPKPKGVPGRPPRGRGRPAPPAIPARPGGRRRRRPRPGPVPGVGAGTAGPRLATTVTNIDEAIAAAQASLPPPDLTPPALDSPSLGELETVSAAPGSTIPTLPKAVPGRPGVLASPTLPGTLTFFAPFLPFALRATTPTRPRIRPRPGEPSRSLDPRIPTAPEPELALALAPVPSPVPVPATAPRTATDRCQVVKRRRRKKGKCREGFFRESPGSTKFTTWRERDCQ